MKSRDIALALIRREAEESGELTVLALRAAQEHRIGYTAMMAAAREGLRRRARRAAPASHAPSEESADINPPIAPVSPQNRITEAQAAITELRADLARHTRQLEDARQGGAASNEIGSIETLIANDHSLIASWERVIREEEENATEPELIALRELIEHMTFEDCVLSLISRDGGQELSVPMPNPENLAKLRDDVLWFARRGRLTLRSAETPAGSARRLPIVMLDGKLYYRDERLREHRAVNNPHDRRPL